MAGSPSNAKALNLGKTFLRPPSGGPIDVSGFSFGPAPSVHIDLSRTQHARRPAEPESAAKARRQTKLFSNANPWVRNPTASKAEKTSDPSDITVRAFLRHRPASDKAVTSNEREFQSNGPHQENDGEMPQSHSENLKIRDENTENKRVDLEPSKDDRHQRVKRQRESRVTFSKDTKPCAEEVDFGSEKLGLQNDRDRQAMNEMSARANHGETPQHPEAQPKQSQLESAQTVSTADRSSRTSPDHQTPASGNRTDGKTADVHNQTANDREATGFEDRTERKSNSQAKDEELVTNNKRCENGGSSEQTPQVQSTEDERSTSCDQGKQREVLPESAGERQVDKSQPRSHERQTLAEKVTKSKKKLPLSIKAILRRADDFARSELISYASETEQLAHELNGELQLSQQRCKTLQEENANLLRQQAKFKDMLLQRHKKIQSFLTSISHDHKTLKSEMERQRHNVEELASAVTSARDDLEDSRRKIPTEQEFLKDWLNTFKDIIAQGQSDTAMTMALVRESLSIAASLEKSQGLYSVQQATILDNVKELAAYTIKSAHVLSDERVQSRLDKTEPKQMKNSLTCSDRSILIGKDVSFVSAASEPSSSGLNVQTAEELTQPEFGRIREDEIVPIGQLKSCDPITHGSSVGASVIVIDQKSDALKKGKNRRFQSFDSRRTVPQGSPLHVISDIDDRRGSPWLAGDRSTNTVGNSLLAHQSGGLACHHTPRSNDRRTVCQVHDSSQTVGKARPSGYLYKATRQQQTLNEYNFQQDTVPESPLKVSGASLKSLGTARGSENRQSSPCAAKADSLKPGTEEGDNTYISISSDLSSISSEALDEAMERLGAARMQASPEIKGPFISAKDLLVNSTIETQDGCNDTTNTTVFPRTKRKAGNEIMKQTVKRRAIKQDPDEEANTAISREPHVGKAGKASRKAASKFSDQWESFLSDNGRQMRPQTQRASVTAEHFSN